MKRNLILFLLVFLLTVGMIAFRYVKTERQTAAPAGSGLAAEERTEPPDGSTPVQTVPDEVPERPETEPVPGGESGPQPDSGAEDAAAGPEESAAPPSGDHRLLLRTF